MNNTKVVLITGGGRGIGAATSKLFASKGYAVCINYKSNLASAEAVASDIRAAGNRCITVQADVSV